MDPSWVMVSNPNEMTFVEGPEGEVYDDLGVSKGWKHETAYETNSLI